MSSTYFQDYMFYASENEANEKYHMWACLATISVALSRRVWISQGDWKVYPNVYLLFVGDPASGKSTALRLAEKLVHRFTKYPVAPSAITREALFKLMGESKHSFTYQNETVQFSPMTVMSDELVLFLGAEPVRMIDFMTAVWDAEGAFTNATKNKGVDSVTNPCLVFCGLLTPSSLDSMQTAKLVSGGFSRRVLPVCSNSRGKPKPRPVFSAEHEAARNRCVDYAKRVQELVGPFQWTPQAAAWFDNWYINTKDRIMRSVTCEVMKRYWAARDNLLIKVAMLISITNSLELILDTESLIKADQMLTDLEDDISMIFGGGGRNELSTITKNILRFVVEQAARGPVLEATIRARFYADAEDNEIINMLNHLCDTGKLKRDVQVSPTRTITSYLISESLRQRMEGKADQVTIS